MRLIGDAMAMAPGIGARGKNRQGAPVGVGLQTLLSGWLAVGGAGV